MQKERRYVPDGSGTHDARSNAAVPELESRSLKSYRPIVLLEEHYILDHCKSIEEYHPPRLHPGHILHRSKSSRRD